MAYRTRVARGVEEFFVEEVRRRGEVVSLFRFAAENGIAYTWLLLCAKEAERRGLIVCFKQKELRGHPNRYIPAEED